MKRFIIIMVISIFNLNTLCSCAKVPEINKNQGEETGSKVQEEEAPRPIKGNVNFRLLHSYIIDTERIEKYFALVEGTSLTYFSQVYDLESWKDFREFDHINFKDFDFDFTSEDYKDEYLAVTIGRELVDIQYEYCGEPYPPYRIAKADITLGEKYHDHTMFLYVMDKITLLDTVIGGHKFYIMNGNKKVYMGEKVGDLNTREYN